MFKQTINAFRQASDQPPRPQGTRQFQRKPLARISTAGRGAWTGADHSRLTAGWLATEMPINQQLHGDLNTLRSRSRSLAKNSDYIRRFFQLVRNNVVGPTGFKFTSSVVTPRGKADKESRAAIQAAWADFSKKGVPCSQGRLSLWDLQNLAVESLFRDGEVILLQYTGKDEGRHGLTFKLVDPVMLDSNLNDDARRIRMGVETDARGRPKAYHFHSTDTTHAAFYTVGGKGYVRVEAKHVIHRFLHEYADQIRGVPHMAAAMFRLKMLDKYEESELVAADLAASTMGFIERGEDGGSLEGARAVLDDDGGEVYPEEPTIEAQAGAFHYLENGAKIHEWSADHAPTAYRDFVKGVLRGISSSLGVSYHSLANDLEGVNYSSIRTAVLEERDQWKAVQNWMIENILDPIFERWLESVLLNGSLTAGASRVLHAGQFLMLQAHTFTGRRWQWVDPLKDMTANEKAVQLGLRSRASIIRELGEDPEEVWREISEENTLLESLGIKAKPPEPEEEKEEPDDAESDEGNGTGTED